MHTDLDGPILSKKLQLCQNWMQLDKKCLKFIQVNTPSFYLHFKIQTLFLAFKAHRMDKTEKIIKNIA